MAAIEKVASREAPGQWRRPSFVVEVAPGTGDTFSLEGRDGLHFVARTPGCAAAAEEVST